MKKGKNMKVLIVYYSRTGTTKNTSELISKKLNCDIEEIKDTKDRLGIINYIKSGKDAMTSSLTTIESIEKDPSKYDHVIIASPVWAGTIASPILTYITENKGKFHNLSFISTCKSTCEKALNDMEKITEKKPISTMFVDKNDIDSKLDEKIDIFISGIKT